MLRWTLIGLLVGLTGCSGCDDDGNDIAIGDGGMDASTDGMMPLGDGDGDTDTGDTGTPDRPRFTCGETVCFVPGEDLVELFAGLGFPTGVAPFSPCCTEEDNQCGLVARTDAGTQCIPRPPSDDECPDVDLFGVLQPGCCIEELGVCGVNGAQIGAGCIDASGGLGPVFGVEPQPCGPQDDDGGVEGDDDAGGGDGDGDGDGADAG